MKYGGVNFTNIKDFLYSYPFNRGPPENLVYRISACEKKPKKQSFILGTKRRRQTDAYQGAKDPTVYFGNTELPE